MTYSIKEVFNTLQGEGMHTGRAAVFVRFTGCNMWSGWDKDRERDAARNLAQCPIWCDTDFTPTSAMHYTKDDLREAIGKHDSELVVFTGGEPLLQLDRELIMMCKGLGKTVAVETNGTVRAKPGVLPSVYHLCVSPKQTADRLELIPQMLEEIPRSSVMGTLTELKVVYPAYDPANYESIRKLFTRAYVSPVAETSSRGKSLVQHDIEQQAARYCMANPGWSLSLQTHKYLDLP